MADVRRQMLSWGACKVFTRELCRRYLVAYELKLVPTGGKLGMSRLEEVRAVHKVHVLVPAGCQPLHLICPLIHCGQNGLIWKSTSLAAV